MTILEFVHHATKKLTSGNVPTARLDTLILLEDALAKDRSWLLAHPSYVIQPTNLEILNKQVERRANHEPLAYIRGRSEFYGREFFVTADTLQPRPETETIIELVLELVESHSFKAQSIIDVGTGSGCLAITTKLEMPDTKVFATDISDKCLKIAEKNAMTLQVDVQFYKANLLEALPSIIFHLPPIILANLPYVPDSHTINQAAMHEPRLAIFGGEDGLNYYRLLFAQVKKLKIPVELILTESLPTQHEQLEALANTYGYTCLQTQDFIQVFVRKEPA